jgi:hypothetical protein
MSDDTANSQITEKLQRLEKLKKFPTASFAIWNDIDIDKNNQYIEKHLEELKFNIILIGENQPPPRNSNIILPLSNKIEYTRSDREALKKAIYTDTVDMVINTTENNTTEKPFFNFHNNKGPDKLLKETTEECDKLKGAYMTDISQQNVQKSKYLKVSPDDIRAFKKQLTILGKKEYSVICFGKGTFRKLLECYNPKKIGSYIVDENGHRSKVEFAKVDNMDDYIFHCYIIEQYNAYQHGRDKQQFIGQLKEVNKLISDIK